MEGSSRIYTGRLQPLVCRRIRLYLNRVSRNSAVLPRGQDMHDLLFLQCGTIDRIEESYWVGFGRWLRGFGNEEWDCDVGPRQSTDAGEVSLVQRIRGFGRLGSPALRGPTG